MIEPMTDAEWQEFGRMTLHGSPPWETLRRIFGMVDRLMVERDQYRMDLEARDAEVGELKDLSSRAWYHYKNGFDDLPEFKTVEEATDYFWGSASFVVAADPNVKPPAGYVARGELEARITEASEILRAQPPDRFTVAAALCVLDNKKGSG